MRRPIAAVAAMLLLAAGSASAQTVRVVRSSIKVRPTDVPPAVSTIELHAARNEFEALQVVILGGSGGLSSVSVDPPSFVLDNSNPSVPIPPGEVRVYREGIVTFSHASSPEGGAGDWPDPLIPVQEDGPAVVYDSASGTWVDTVSGGETRNAFPVDVGANRNVTAWIDIHVPPTQQPGTYHGTVNAYANNHGTLLGSVTVTLVVRGFAALSSTSSLPSTFGSEADQMCLAHGHASGSFCTGNREIHTFIRLYGRLLLDHRLTLEVEDNPNDVGYANASTRFDNDYGDLINGRLANQRLQGAQYSTIRDPWANGSCGKGGWGPCRGASDLQTALQNWAQFAKDTQYGRPFSWFQRTFLYAEPDEPGNNCANWTGANLILDQGQWAHAVDPAFRVMVTADVEDYNACAVSNGRDSSIDILDPVLDQMDPSSGPNHRNEYPNKTVWMYQSCDSFGCSSFTETNWPSVMVDATGVQNRAEPWMHYIYNAPGMLYWNATAKLASAWNPDGTWGDFVGGQGDGTLVYPGTPRPVSGGSSYGIGGTTDLALASIRLKMIREGLEDYEYLKMCEAATSRANALSIANQMFPMDANNHGAMQTADNYPNSDPAGYAARLESVRDQLAACIGGPPPNPQLTVARTGSGSGSVTSSPAGISCGTSCSATYTSGTVVTLTATADPGSTFGGFSGACTSSTNTCTFTITADSTVNASFVSNTCAKSDCFNRADNSSLGPGWNTYSGTMQISGGQATNSAVNGIASQWLTSVGADQDVSVDCKVTGPGSNCGLMARWLDANDLYYAYLDAGLGRIDLWKVQGGTATSLGSVTKAIAAGIFYHLRLVAQGSTLSVYFNNESTASITASDTAISGTYGGLHTFGSATQTVWYSSFDMKVVTGQSTIIVAKSGTGSGSVTSSPAGIDCGATCSAGFANGTSLTLTAGASSGSTFGGFSGACTSSTTTCTFTVSSNATVNAVFTANDFSMAVNPSSNSAQQGGTAAYSVTTAVTAGSAQGVSFSTSGLPAGVTASFNPSAVTASNGSTMTLTVGSTVATGTYNFNVVGTGTATTKTVAASVTVTPATTGTITFRAASTYISQSTSTMSMDLTVPPGVKANDVLIATIFAGDYTSSTLPVVGAPNGWTLVTQKAHGQAALLQVYVHVANGTDANHTYSWTTNVWVGAVCSLTAYSGVNVSSPIDQSLAQDNTSASATYSTPSFTTASPGDLLLAAYAGYSLNSPPASSWSTPTGMAQRVNRSNGGLLALSNDDKTQASAGNTGTFSSTATPAQTYALTALVALRPASTTPPISFRASATYASQSTSTMDMTLTAPASVQVNDVLVATIFAGDYLSTTLPVVTAPSGWTLVTQAAHGQAALLQVYSHVAVTGDPGRTFHWTTNVWVGAACSMVAYSGANSVTPVDAKNSQDNATASSTYSTPQVTTTAANDLLLTTYAGYTQSGTTSWSAPAGMTQRTNFNNAGLLSLSNDDKLQAAAGATGAFAATSTPAQSYALTALVALKK